MELLIGVTISILIFMAASSVIITMLSSNTKIKNIQSLEQVKNDVAASISTSIKWATTIDITANSIVVDGVEYALVDGRVVKGEVPITPSDVVVTRFEIKDRSATPDIVGVEIGMDLHARSKSSIHDTLSLAVSQRKTEIESL